MSDIKKHLPNYFLILLLAVALYFAYIIFRPYIAAILLAAIFASLFFPVYKWLLDKLKGRAAIASFLTVLLFILVILIPLINFTVVLVNEAIAFYPTIEAKLSNGGAENALSQLIMQAENFQNTYLAFLNTEFDFRQIIIDLGNSFTQFIINNADNILNATTAFFTQLFFMLITMYFLFKDGKKFIDRLTYLTPLSTKYDRKLYEKFREVSKSTILSSIATGIIQGGLAAIAYLIVGYPVFLLGVATAIASLIPIVGTALVWVPVTLVLAISGHWASAIFLLVWGMLVIGMSDNIIRTKLIQSKSKIHPLLVFFSIFGGLSAFGFLGIIFGPLILAIVLTIFHIYELEYEHILER